MSGVTCKIPRDKLVSEECSKLSGKNNKMSWGKYKMSRNTCGVSGKVGGISEKTVVLLELSNLSS